MGVVIDELVTDMQEESRPIPAESPAAGACCGRGEPDIDRLDYQLARRRQRRARLWAD